MSAEDTRLRVRRGFCAGLWARIRALQDAHRQLWRPPFQHHPLGECDHLPYTQVSYASTPPCHFLPPFSHSNRSGSSPSWPASHRYCPSLPASVTWAGAAHSHRHSGACSRAGTMDAPCWASGGEWLRSCWWSARRQRARCPRRVLRYRVVGRPGWERKRCSINQAIQVSASAMVRGFGRFPWMERRRG